jgi:hypothetical protein
MIAARNVPSGCLSKVVIKYSFTVHVITPHIYNYYIYIYLYLWFSLIIGAREYDTYRQCDGTKLRINGYNSGYE